MSSCPAPPGHGLAPPDGGRARVAPRCGGADRPRRALAGLPARSPRGRAVHACARAGAALRPPPRRTPATVCRSRCSSPSSRGWGCLGTLIGIAMRPFRAREPAAAVEPAPPPQAGAHPRAGAPPRAGAGPAAAVARPAQRARRARPRPPRGRLPRRGGGRQPAARDGPGRAARWSEHSAGRWGAPGLWATRRRGARQARRRALRRGRDRLRSEPAPPVPEPPPASGQTGSLDRADLDRPAASRMSRITCCRVERPRRRRVAAGSRPGPSPPALRNGGRTRSQEHPAGILEVGPVPDP